MFKNLDIIEHDERWANAVKVFRAGDRAGALFLFRKLANDGCAPAILEVGNIYEIGGKGIKQDKEKAIQWYIRSVELVDDVKAHLALGRAYLNVDQNDENYHKAYYHLNLVYEHDQRMGACYGLGLLHEFGLGVEKNLEEAERYYGYAEAKGHLLSLQRLAILKFKNSKIQGIILWLKSAKKILPVALKNTNDSRLTIS